MMNNVVTTMHNTQREDGRIVVGRELGKDGIAWCPECGWSRVETKPYSHAMEHTARTAHVTMVSTTERVVFNVEDACYSEGRSKQ